jgi:hypothetical protein
VEEAGRDRRDVHLEVHEEVGNLEGVRDVGLARGSLLTPVGLLRESVRPLQELEVGARLILRNLVDESLELGHVAYAFV